MSCFGSLSKAFTKKAKITSQETKNRCAQIKLQLMKKVSVTSINWAGIWKPIQNGKNSISGLRKCQHLKSSIQHLAAHPAQCRGNSHYGTPDVSDGSSETVSDSNSPHTRSHHAFPLPLTICRFSCGLLRLLSIFDHCSLLTVLSSSAWLCSASATFLTPPERSSGPFPITHCSPQPSEPGSPLITNITPLSLDYISRRHHSAFSLYFGSILTLTFHILQSSFNTAHSFPKLV